MICETCEGSGFIVDVEANRAVSCSCRTEGIRAERAKRLNAEIPAQYASCSRSTWKGPWLLSQADTWVPRRGEDPWCAVLFGPRGAGKSHAATALYRTMMERFDHLQGAWLSTDDAIGRIKAEFSSDPEFADTKETMLTVELLLLDDVGRARSTPFSLELIREVLYKRHLHKRPTILTSNALKLEDFDAIDPALSDRLRQGTMRFDFTGLPNRRLGA